MLQRVQDMSGSGRKIALLLALLLLLVSLVACTPSPVMPPESQEPPAQPEPQERADEPVEVGTEPEPDHSDDYDRVAVHSPVSIPWLMVNPLEITEEIRTQGRYQDRLVFIKGLRDNDVQATINDNLSALYAHLKERDLPPMRGVRVLIGADKKPAVSYLQTQVYFSHNNVLSLVATNFREYNINGYSHYMNIAETRNFDLATGREITLKDVLNDDVDYLQVISDAVGEQLLRSSVTEEYGYGPYEAGLGFSCVSPFRGVREDQAFYLTPAGIMLVLDYRTPEFDTGFWYRSLQVPFTQLEGTVALTKRFEHLQEELYISQDSPVYEFIHPSPGSAPPPQRVAREERIDNVLVLAGYGYTAETPVAVVEFMRRQYDKHTSALSKLKGMTDNYWLLTHNVSATQAGPYTTVNVRQRQQKSTRPFDIHEAQWIDSMGFWGDDNTSMTSSSYCFDAEGNQLHLRDIFIPGFDYKKVIEAAYEEQVQRQHWIKLPPFSEVWDTLQFELRVNDVSFRTKFIDMGDHVTPVHFSLSFKDIGCKNLSIFQSP